MQPKHIRWPVQPVEYGRKRRRDHGPFRLFFSPRAEQKLTVATKLSILDNVALKGATIQGIEKALAEVVHFGFPPAAIGVKHAFSRFVEMALANTVHHGLQKKFIQNSFER